MAEERPYFRIYVYNCLESEQGVIQGLLADAGLMNRNDSLALDVSYNVEEMGTGFDEDLADALRRAAPGATWAMWTDPLGGELGELRAYTPEHGPYGPQGCTGGGDVVFTLEQITKAVGGAHRVDAKLSDAMGYPWSYEAMGVPR